MKLWAKWEILDISAIIEAIELKSKMEARRAERISSKASNQKDLEKLNTGKNTLTTIFMSKDGKVNKITNLTRTISQSEKELECMNLFLKICVLQLNQAAIPYFKKDKVNIYNDLINTYS
jgi:hypothetical protein